ncbi:hypothetical protein [Halovivax gelatinilyticus]|uniref:hypothetical protein n=1 Tax=Halovivax gelatinilyticus TaxID=2961597 RepID=UPI0020CA92EC|nr:hypothetical protein [Halovivax gelatinilyticus]
MRISNLLAGDRSTPTGLANFDSTTAFVRASASALRGEAFPALGMIHPTLRPLAKRVNRLPRSVRTSLYTRGGANEGVDPDSLGDIDVERFREWVTAQYPDRGYPAVIVGSSNGAAVHLSALLGIPYLPQTFLVPVRRSMDADAIRADIAWGREHAPEFLRANPDVTLAQMHDPNQDRLMVEKLAYFRTKSRVLGPAYEEFLETVLEPGGTILTLECTYEWPAIDLGDRHTFQVGGHGGLEPTEYYEGSELVADFLADQGAGIRAWNTPDPDVEVPESEWGFEPKLRDDVERFARERGHGVRRLSFDHPEDLSPFVADLYRDYYATRSVESNRLFVQSFALLEPWWTLRTGSVPYWTAFNTQPNADALESYLSATEPYDEIWATLFAHGIESAGLASIDRWRSVLSAARTRSGFVGVDEAEFPYDVETHVRYHADLPETIRARYAHPPPMAFDRFEERANDLGPERDIRLHTTASPHAE